jgi:putative Ca2+/H+ antiporter (TMEM165/GDT1 family)
MEKENIWHGLYAGLAIVIISGFGDKLFFLNMIFGSINNFCYGFWVALSISEIMNLMNITLGQILKLYIDISILENAAIAIFCLLGALLIYKGIKIPEKMLIQNYEDERKLLINNKRKSKDNENIDNEDKKINESNHYKQIDIYDMERKFDEEDEIGLFNSWWEYLIIYFLSTIGDKSQIASIIISIKYNFISILNGTSIGIILLVFIAMIIGKFISRLLTNKQISIIGGIFFFLYALVFFIDRKMSINLDNLDDFKK